jgi:hypothetical protein
VLIHDTAITVTAEPCWIVTQADGSPTGFEDSEPHYASDSEARKVAYDLTCAGDPEPIVKQLDSPCASATAACGYRYDEDDEGEQHWPDSAEEFRTYLVGTADYRPGPNGSLLCPADRGCEECDALEPEVIPAEIPSQLDLPTTDVRPYAIKENDRG